MRRFQVKIFLKLWQHSQGTRICTRKPIKQLTAQSYPGSAQSEQSYWHSFHSMLGAKWGLGSNWEVSKTLFNIPNLLHHCPQWAFLDLHQLLGWYKSSWVQWGMSSGGWDIVALLLLISSPACPQHTLAGLNPHPSPSLECCLSIPHWRTCSGMDWALHWHAPKAASHFCWWLWPAHLCYGCYATGLGLMLMECGLLFK